MRLPTNTSTGFAVVCKRLEWSLLTTQPVADAYEAERMLTLCALRWRIEDYFGSVPTPLIETALNCAGLDDATVADVSDTIQAINSIPDHAGATRRGIPVSQDDLFWYVADLVLRPVDKLLAQHPGIRHHLRWVDDFFIAVDNNAAVDHALRVLTAALAPIGLHRNLAKTRVTTQARLGIG